MIYTITSSISREKLKVKDYEPDSVVISEPKSTIQISEREFYDAAVELLAQMYPEVISSSIS